MSNDRSSRIPPTRAGSEKRYEDAEGSMVLEIRSPQLVVTRVRGQAREAMVDFYLREFIAFASVATLRIDVFHDWADVIAFDPGARQTFVKWGEDRREHNRKLMRRVHILAGSTMVFLALGAARIIYGAQLDVYRSRVTWEDALRDAEREPSTDRVH